MTKSGPLAVNLAGVPLASPIVMASGTWGYGTEGQEFLNYKRIGAIATKGVTLKPRIGNPPPRLKETPSGLLNSVGLENIGIDTYLEEKLPALKDCPSAIIANYAGFTISEFVKLTRMLAAEESIAILEANVSCPNVEEGGKAFGTNAKQIHEIAKLIRTEAQGKPFFLKLSPNVTDIVEIADAALEGGASGLTIANCYVGLAINIRRRRPHFQNIMAGLSGPAIKPLTLRLVYEVRQAFPQIPIIGLGGVMNGSDVVEYLLAGADAVGIGVASISNPSAAERILQEVEAYLQDQGLASVQELKGALNPWEPR